MGDSEERRLEELSDWYDDNDTLQGTDADYDDEIDVEFVPTRTVVRSVRLSATTLRRLDEAAAARGLGPTELMRRWIEERLDTEEKDEPVRIAAARSAVEQLAKATGVPVEVLVRTSVA